MHGEAFVEAVRESNATALDRLGSDKALVATTDATLERDRVLESATAAEARAAATFDAWVEDEPDGRAREAFAAAADREREHLDRVRDLADAAPVADPDADALHEYLRGLDDTVERTAGGLVARPLVASRSLLQVINFFVNEGDTTAADLFRALRAETDEQVDTGGTVVAAVCENEADRERASAAAEGTIDAAYGAYVDSLAGLGIDPKPVC